MESMRSGCECEAAINFGGALCGATERAIAMLSLIVTPSGYHPDAVKACASLNTSAKLGLMRGYGEIDT